MINKMKSLFWGFFFNLQSIREYKHIDKLLQHHRRKARIAIISLVSEKHKEESCRDKKCFLDKVASIPSHKG